MLIALLELTRRRLRRLGIVGFIASLLLGLWIELPLVEKAASDQARKLTAALIADEEHALRQLERTELKSTTSIHVHRRTPP